MRNNLVGYAPPSLGLVGLLCWPPYDAELEHGGLFFTGEIAFRQTEPTRRRESDALLASIAVECVGV